VLFDQLRRIVVRDAYLGLLDRDHFVAIGWGDGPIAGVLFVVEDLGVLLLRAALFKL
jgi:hypothetical protein